MLESLTKSNIHYNKQCTTFKAEIFKQEKTKDLSKLCVPKIEKLSTNTNNYLSVPCACNENCSSISAPLSPFTSPLEQGYGEGNAIGILYLLLPIFTFHLSASHFICI